MEVKEIAPLQSIDFGATGDEAIMQNISFLLGSVMYSFPMDREFGWSPKVDDPFPVVQSSLSAEIVQLIQRYEPTVEVIEVLVQEQDVLDGMLKPVVRVRLNG